MDNLSTGVPSDKSRSRISTQKVLGVRLDSKKYLRFLLSETVLHCVVDISGLSGVEIPYGTEALRTTLNTLAMAIFSSSVFGSALI